MRFNIEKSKEEQKKLARKLIIKNDFDEINTVGGVDQAFINNKIISAIVVCEYPTMKVVEKQYAIVDSKIPYIPGFLSYRESPAIVEAFNKLEIKPDILIVDGHGITHPRKLGIASHVGLILDVPTIGISDKLLRGTIKDEKIYIDEDLRGKLVKTKEHAKPVIISVGHRISLRTAFGVVEKSIIPPHKLPEPLHLAHRYANKIRKEEISE